MVRGALVFYIKFVVIFSGVVRGRKEVRRVGEVKEGKVKGRRREVLEIRD